MHRSRLNFLMQAIVEDRTIGRDGRFSDDSSVCSVAEAEDNPCTLGHAEVPAEIAPDSPLTRKYRRVIRHEMQCVIQAQQQNAIMQQQNAIIQQQNAMLAQMNQWLSLLAASPSVSVPYLVATVKQFVISGKHAQLNAMLSRYTSKELEKSELILELRTIAGRKALRQTLLAMVPQIDELQELQRKRKREQDDDALGREVTVTPARAMDDDDALGREVTVTPARAMDDDALGREVTVAPARAMDDDALGREDTVTPARAMDDSNTLARANDVINDRLSLLADVASQKRSLLSKDRRDSEARFILRLRPIVTSAQWKQVKHAAGSFMSSQIDACEYIARLREICGHAVINDMCECLTGGRAPAATPVAAASAVATPVAAATGEQSDESEHDESEQPNVERSRPNESEQPNVGETLGSGGCVAVALSKLVNPWSVEMAMQRLNANIDPVSAKLRPDLRVPGFVGVPNDHWHPYVVKKAVNEEGYHFRKLDLSSTDLAEKLKVGGYLIDGVLNDSFVKMGARYDTNPEDKSTPRNNEAGWRHTIAVVDGRVLEKEFEMSAKWLWLSAPSMATKGYMYKILKVYHILKCSGTSECKGCTARSRKQARRQNDEPQTSGVIGRRSKRLHDAPIVI